MRLTRPILCIALLLAAAPAAAEKLWLTLGVGSGWEDRSNRSTEDPSLRLRPGFRLEDEAGRFTYKAEYRPIWEYFLDDRGDEGWSHDAQIRGAWDVGPRTRITFRDRFIRAKSIDLFNELLGPAGDDDPGLEESTLAEVFEDRRAKNNAFFAGVSHRLSPRYFVSMNVRHSYLDESNRRKANTLATDLALNYNLSESDIIGAGLNYSHQTNEPEGFDEQSTDFIGVNARWSHDFGQGLSMSLQGGPTLVLQDDLPDPPSLFPDRARFPVIATPDGLRSVNAASCPTLSDGTPFLSADCGGIPPTLSAADVQRITSDRVDLLLVEPVPSSDDSDVTFFADMSLFKEWEKVTGTLSYRRQASTTAELGSSTIDDLVSGTLRWKPTRRVRTLFSVFYRHESRDTDGRGFRVALRPRSTGAEAVAMRAVKVNRDFDSDTVTVRGSLSYSWTRNIQLGTSAQYQYRTEGGGDYHRVNLTLNISYLFDPIDI